MASNVPKEHDQSLNDISGASRPHVAETDQQSQHENSSKCTVEKQMTVAEAHKPTFKSEKLCKKKTLKMTDINGNVFMKICRLLNLERPLGGDYRTLAANLGYNIIDIQVFSQGSDPTKSLLLHWCTGENHMAEEILNISKEMNRYDIVQLLKEEIEKCNCQNCASLC